MSEPQPFDGRGYVLNKSGDPAACFAWVGSQEPEAQGPANDIAGCAH